MGDKTRRSVLAQSAALAGVGLWPGLNASAQTTPLEPKKVLRYAFPIAESSFDPARISDLYSRTVTSHIFEALYAYDHLARPAKIKPLTAAAMPEVSDDFRTWTVRVQPKIYFANDRAFKGQRRELVAQDYIFAFQRFADPANTSPYWSTIEALKIKGLAEQRQRALDTKQAFDYGRELPGLRLLDRYTVQFVLEQPAPRFIETLAASDLLGGVAKEVVAFYGEDVPAHPVGTGPFKLAEWRRSSFIALERNPDYRPRFYDGEPAADDADGQALLARFKGRRLPIIDRVEVSIIEETQPRWLSFLNGQSDFMERVPADFVNTAMPGGKLAPNLAKRGMQGYRTLGADQTMHYFNMEDPVVGGYTPDKVALRRAINLAIDLDREIRLVRRGAAVPAQSALVPGTSGYDPAFRSENSEYSPAKARALLDMYGYVDRNGDGWREMPDGSPLELNLATQSTQLDRQFNELWQKNMQAIGIRVRFTTAQWPENMKAARAGKLTIWELGSQADAPDGVGALARLYGPESGGQNLAFFKLPAFDAVYEKLLVMPDGPERQALFLQAKELAIAYAPYKYHVHRIFTDIAAAPLQGYRRPSFWYEWWHMVDFVAPDAAQPNKSKSTTS